MFLVNRNNPTTRYLDVVLLYKRDLTINLTYDSSEVTANDSDSIFLLVSHVDLPGIEPGSAGAPRAAFANVETFQTQSTGERTRTSDKLLVRQPP